MFSALLTAVQKDEKKKYHVRGVGTKSTQLPPPLIDKLRLTLV